MALGLELKLRMGMQLVMTPQLQLAIRLLQMSNLELTEYLEEELEKNPLLDREGEEFGEAAEPEATPAPRNREDAEVEAAPERMEINEELPVDASWGDVYDEPYAGVQYESSGGSGSGSGSAEAPPIENTLTQGSTLADHLTWQLNLSAMDDRERILGLAIIDAIDDNGYLTATLEQLARIANAGEEELEDVLVLVQSFEPAGVGARGLEECLRLQLKAQGRARSPYTDLLEHLDDLARRDFRKLTRLLKLSEAALGEAIRVIQSLNPKPGLAFGSEQAAYVVPDVFVRKVGGVWSVEVNPDTLPRIRINPYYADAQDRPMSGRDRQFFSENSRSAQWLLKSLEQRTRTIVRVAESIVNFQEEFLEQGPEHLKPLILKDVAEDVGVHESTISRVTNNKYMHTPRGIFEFKYFFSSSLAAEDGGSHSSEAVKFKIRKLVEEESPRRPLSDERLAQLLGEQGIQVARRTVAKYREALGIPSSSRRKRLG